MNRKFIPISLFLLAVILLGGVLPFSRPVKAQTATDTVTATSTVTATPPRIIATVTREPAVMDQRPVVMIESYYLDKDTIRVGDSFTLYITLKNKGDEPATNLVLSMLNDSFLPQAGGVVALERLGSQGGETSSQTVSHPFLVSSALAGMSNGTIPVKLSYSGPDGTQYSESFSITLGLLIYTGPVITQTPTPTATAAPVVRPQLVVESYVTDVDPLQPGTIFDLDLNVRNLGNADARSVTMVLGGGVTPDVNGTPQPGGVSGGSSDLTNFAPLGSSNIVFLGDVSASAQIQSKVKLIVNVAANPGAYTLKLSFVYTDQKGVRLVDDQIITLLVFQLPMMEVSFYRDPNPLFANQMNILPLQVVNLGRKSAVLGNMNASAENADLTNNVSLVGPLDPGGSFTLDANYMPFQAGEQQIQVVINYTDDFNQSRQITVSVPVSVQELELPPADLTPGAPGVDPGGIPAPVEETLWQKVLRFFRGLLGLGSGETQPTPAEGMPEPVVPSDGKVVPSGGGKMP
jgi:hypothetical protein